MTLVTSLRNATTHAELAATLASNLNPQRTTTSEPTTSERATAVEKGGSYAPTLG